jgi:hypothetical protein
MISGPYYGPDSRHAHTMGRIAGGFYHESDNARESDDARCGNTPCEYPRSSIPPWIGHSLLARLERCLSRREVAARAAAQRASWAPGFPTACPSPVLARTIWSAGILTCELPKVLVCIGRTASSFYDLTRLCHFSREKKNSQHNTICCRPSRRCLGGDCRACACRTGRGPWSRAAAP